MFFFLGYAGSDDVSISHGFRVIVHACVDSADVHHETDAMIICRSESSLMPPADFKSYNSTRKGISDVHSVPLFPVCLRKSREAKARRLAKPIGLRTTPDNTDVPIALPLKVGKPSCLDSTPEIHDEVRASDVDVNKHIKADFEDVIVEEDTDADLYMVRSLDAESTPDRFREILEEALDTLSFSLRKCPTLPADSADRLQPLPEAYADDCGVLLPLEHCAFLGCAW